MNIEKRRQTIGAPTNGEVWEAVDHLIDRFGEGAIATVIHPAGNPMGIAETVGDLGTLSVIGWHELPPVAAIIPDCDPSARVDLGCSQETSERIYPLLYPQSADWSDWPTHTAVHWDGYETEVYRDAEAMEWADDRSALELAHSRLVDLGFDETDRDLNWERANCSEVGR